MNKVIWFNGLKNNLYLYFYKDEIRKQIEDTIRELKAFNEISSVKYSDEKKGAVDCEEMILDNMYLIDYYKHRLKIFNLHCKRFEKAIMKLDNEEYRILSKYITEGMEDKEIGKIMKKILLLTL